jgi:hypothetical protein
MKNNPILSISNFLEDTDNHIFGFTVTYQNGRIKNYLVQGNTENKSDQIKKLKSKYKNFK